MKLVYVISKNVKPLMPTKRCNRVAYLLKNGLAKVVKLNPFTIQLLYDTTEYVQEVVVGLDTGANRVGCSAVTKDGKVLYQSETILRDNISKLMTQRREYRRTRRNRKTRYRKPRFLNRKRPKGWLPPSLKSKSDSTVKVVAKLSEILPFKKVRIEIAKFDIQKLKNPNISGVQYQQGALYQYHNIRHYVFTRDGYTCQICKKKGGILITHHIIPRSQGGSDIPDNLITLHDSCHKDFHAGKIKKTFRKPKTYREATIITTLKNDIIKKLKVLGFKVEVTFGNITKVNRIQLGLPKNPYNDAIAIALNTGKVKVIQPNTYFINKCFPKGNYRLFKGAHSNIRNQSERYLFGYQRNDIVKVNKKGEKGIGYIKGRMSSGYFVIYDFLGNKLFSSVHHRYLKLVERFKTLSTMEARIVP